MAAFTRNLVVVGIVEVALIVFVVGYALIAFRRVYGDGWRPVLMKSVGIAVPYFVAGITGLIAAPTWAAIAG